MRSNLWIPVFSALSLVLFLAVFVVIDNPPAPATSQHSIVVEPCFGFVEKEFCRKERLVYGSDVGIGTPSIVGIAIDVSNGAKIKAPTDYLRISAFKHTTMVSAQGEVYAVLTLVTDASAPLGIPLMRNMTVISDGMNFAVEDGMMKVVRKGEVVTVMMDEKKKISSLGDFNVFIFVEP